MVIKYAAILIVSLYLLFACSTPSEPTNHYSIEQFATDNSSKDARSSYFIADSTASLKTMREDLEYNLILERDVFEGINGYQPDYTTIFLYKNKTDINPVYKALFKNGQDTIVLEDLTHGLGF